jgi:CheY-like chemotaxis protein
MTIRVLVADDQALVRGSFRILVNTAPDLTPVGEASTGTEAIELARREKPDVVLMDIRMPGLDGIEATRQITTSPETSGVRVLILTPRRVRLRRAACGRQRLPAQGHPARRPTGRHPRDRSRGRPPRSRRHPPTHRRVHPPPRPPTQFPEGRWPRRPR